MCAHAGGCASGTCVECARIICPRTRMLWSLRSAASTAPAAVCPLLLTASVQGYHITQHCHASQLFPVMDDHAVSRSAQGGFMTSSAEGAEGAFVCSCLWTSLCCPNDCGATQDRPLQRSQCRLLNRSTMRPMTHRRTRSALVLPPTLFNVWLALLMAFISQCIGWSGCVD